MLLDSELRKKPGNRPEASLQFVQNVTVRRGRIGREGFLRWVLWVFWALILLKCGLAQWAIARWEMPVSAFWVWFPTLLFAALCTIVLLSRDQRVT